MKRLLFSISALLILYCQQAGAQTIQWNAAQIKQHLEKLNVLGSVLYIAAHPDDENTRLLAYLNNDRLYRTAYLSCTRGDGGQNLIGDEQGEQLGLIRTQELLAARRIDGSEQFFTTANDFGFSKSAKESLQFWDHQRVLADMVWVIRQYQPDVMICRFPEDRRAGHGHHWASAVLAHEAFIAAADPAKFPEQLKYLKPWQAKRLLWNTSSFGRNNTTNPEQFHLSIGGFNPLLGESYGEMAAASRSMHKSQGFGSSPTRTQAMEYFETILGDKPKKTLMDGVNTSWSRIAGGGALQSLIASVIDSYDMERPEKSVPALLNILKIIQKLPEGYWKKQKLEETRQLIVACLGLFADADAAEGIVVPGQDLPVSIQFVNRSNVPVTLKKIFIGEKETAVGHSLLNGEGYTVNENIHIADTAAITQPYWLTEDHPTGYYNVANQLLTGRPENKPPYQVRALLAVDGQEIEISRDVLYKHTDDVKGEVYEPLVIAPPVVANIANMVYLFTASSPERAITVQLKSFRDNVSGTLHLKTPGNFSVQTNDLPFTLHKKGDEAILHFTVNVNGKIDTSSSQNAIITAVYNGKSYERGVKEIRHDHIPAITIFPPSETKLVSVDLKTDGKHIGYIAGAGDMVPDALRECGYIVTPITAADISAQELAKFDAIITGIRAYNINNLLRPLQEKLLAYVNNGGTLVVQYNKNGRLVTDRPGPYPFNISGNRVTEEDANVSFLNPENEAMNYPNKITQRDFDGWIQERGLYFTENADPRYKKLFSMHDADSQPLDGSTLVTRYGKGKYVYSCLDFFRELPAGVPGAYRLFANLIARQP